jgi:hypothetical protein
MTFAAMLLGDRVLRNPIAGIAGCCPRAASGHAAAPRDELATPHSITSSAVAFAERYQAQ